MQPTSVRATAPGSSLQARGCAWIATFALGLAACAEPELTTTTASRIDVYVDIDAALPEDPPPADPPPDEPQPDPECEEVDFALEADAARHGVNETATSNTGIQYGTCPDPVPVDISACQALQTSLIATAKARMKAACGCKAPANPIWTWSACTATCSDFWVAVLKGPRWRHTIYYEKSVVVSFECT
jgi:hypothetical protein